jgi:hypothetical protein
MPLRDHSKLFGEGGGSWVGFHGMWASHILTKLNGEQLSQDYRAGFDVHRPDFALPQFEATPNHVVSDEQQDRGFPPTPVLSAFAPIDEPGSTDVTVEYRAGQDVVAAVVFAHRGFSGTPHGRRAFAVKCAKWLQRGTSVIAVNVDSPADVPTDLVELLGVGSSFAWRSATGFSVVAYRVLAIKDNSRLDVWTHAPAIGEELPTVPLWLASDLAVPLELEATYEAACKSLRIG